MTVTPEAIECATCGGTALRVSWGSTMAACYRCQNCHAGGHVARSDSGTVVRQGGVFSRLSNYQTRRARA